VHETNNSTSYSLVYTSEIQKFVDAVFHTIHRIWTKSFCIAYTAYQRYPLPELLEKLLSRLAVKNMKEKEKEFKIPLWARKALAHLIYEAEDMYKLLHVTKKGIQHLQRIPRLYELLLNPNDPKNPVTEKDIERAREEAAIAQAEAEQDYRRSHQQFCISIWAHLESKIRMLCVGFVANEPHHLQSEKFRKIKVVISEYECLSEQEKAMFLIEQLENNVASPLRKGVNRFEDLLAVFGLSGKLEAQVTKNLYELNQVRNLIAHQEGKVDQRFSDSCPWLNISVGDPLNISTHDIERYFVSVMTYCKSITQRVAHNYGVDLEFDTPADGNIAQ